MCFTVLLNLPDCVKDVCCTCVTRVLHVGSVVFCSFMQNFLSGASVCNKQPSYVVYLPYLAVSKSVSKTDVRNVQFTCAFVIMMMVFTLGTAWVGQTVRLLALKSWIYYFSFFTRGRAQVIIALIRCSYPYIMYYVYRMLYIMYYVCCIWYRDIASPDISSLYIHKVMKCPTFR